MYTVAKKDNDIKSYLQLAIDSLSSREAKTKRAKNESTE